MLQSVKEKIFDPLRNSASILFRNNGYEEVSGVDDAEFGILEKETYGTTLGCQPKKKTSPFRNILVIGVTFIIAVVIFVFVVNGISKTEKPHLELNSAASQAEDVTAEELNRLIQAAKQEASIPLKEDVAPEIETQLDVLSGDDAVEELKQLQSEQAEVAKELEDILSKEKEQPNSPLFERIRDLESQLKEQLQQKDTLLTEEIKKVENRLGEVKA